MPLCDICLDGAVARLTRTQKEIEATHNIVVFGVEIDLCDKHYKELVIK